MTISRTGRYLWVVVLALAAGIEVAATRYLAEIPRPKETGEIRVALPRFVQVLLAGGDRYLAANLAGFRSLVVSTERMQEDDYRILGIVQSDVAWLNPAHQDNYYIAAAILPWNGEYDAAQFVLRQAIDGRPFEWGPVFYFAFNLMHFRQEAAEAAEWLLRGARRASDENDRLVLEDLSVRWAEKGYDTAAAIRIVEAMANQSRHAAFKQYLLTRRARLQGLLVLEEAAIEFKAKFGRSALSVAELVQAGVLKSVPVDPFGLGYEINANGKPMMSTTKQGIR